MNSLLLGAFCTLTLNCPQVVESDCQITVAQNRLHYQISVSGYRLEQCGYYEYRRPLNDVQTALPIEGDVYHSSIRAYQSCVRKRDDLIADARFRRELN